MSLRKKLTIAIALIIMLILTINNTLYYIFTERLLVKDQENQMELLARNIATSIEQSQIGAQQVEDIIGEQLRISAIAAQSKLDPKSDQVTNQELAEIAEEIGISHITLLKRLDDDIKGVKSSDPNEIGMSTKDWGYWFEAFNQLFDHRKVTINEGQKLPHYWSGPLNTSYTNPNSVDKWGYFYDGSTDYIINPYVADNQIIEFKNKLGAESSIAAALENNTGLLEITGFNPRTFGKPPIYTEIDGKKYVDFVNKDIRFGKFMYENKAEDVPSVIKAFKTKQQISYTGIVNGKRVLKSFIPINQSSSAPYVIGIVTDYKVIQSILNQQLLNNIFISTVVLLLVVGASYLFAGYLVRPIHRIVSKVEEIAKGNFGAKVKVDRNDELGYLSKQVNIMSQNLSDYTQTLKDKNDEIKYQADHDFLTHLPNLRLFNRMFNEKLADHLTSEENVAIMFLDLDRFKAINDMFGHTAGDRLLREVAMRLLETATEHDVVARIGGDEFVFMASACNREQAVRKAKAIVEQLSKPFHVTDSELFITPSIGISLYPVDGRDAETLIKNSDIAMYRAKERGRNNFLFFSSDMNEEVLRKGKIEKELRIALEKGRFALYYQPQVNLQSGQLVGCEALLRLIHPELGVISPGEFIPVAEETGLITEMGQWVIREVCEQNVAWQEMGYQPLRVSLNLSARQFRQNNLVAFIKDVIAQTGMNPEYLELEITESISMHHEDYVITRLNELKEIGMKIAIDDFGTGYSSLSYLKKYPIDTLKIDKSFMSDIEENAENAEICSIIIAMAQKMRLNVIAEGIETKEQLQFLQQHQCQEGQGYYFSKPLPASEFWRQTAVEF